MKAFWALIGLLLVLPWAAQAQGVYKQQFFDVTDLVDTDSFAGYFNMPIGVTTLFCELDVTALTGGGSLQLDVFGCDPVEMVADGCTDDTDGNKWYGGSSITGVDNDRLMVIPFATTGESSNMSDAEITSPLPRKWALRVNESGSTTASYTLDCVWW